jgi:CheY-like chemotaxis protein
MNAGRQTGGHATDPVVALTADLLFAARVRSAAQAVGATVQLAQSATDLLRLAAGLAPRLVIIDLDSRRLDPIALIGQLKADAATAGIRIVAYVSHVREDLITQARQAGADQVMARGAFARQLPDLLSGS